MRAPHALLAPVLPDLPQPSPSGRHACAQAALIAVRGALELVEMADRAMIHGALPNYESRQVRDMMRSMHALRDTISRMVID